jgi:6-phosphogluconolactonase
LDDPARECAAVLLRAAGDGAHIVLTGGGTPEVAYGLFAQAARATDLDLSGTTMWFGDERCVAPDDPRSNYGMVRRSMLSPLFDLTQPVVRRMKGELGPRDGADDYERQLAGAAPDRFDLVLLGMGPDGHLASLFPDQDSLRIRSRRVVGVEVAGHDPYVPRISMTLPTLARADAIVFLIAGEAKAGMVAAAFGDAAFARANVPTSMLVPLADNIRILLDPGAASQLDPMARH